MAKNARATVPTIKAAGSQAEGPATLVTTAAKSETAISAALIQAADKALGVTVKAGRLVMTGKLDTSTLNKRIDALLRDVRSVSARLHITACECLYHAATTGDVRPMERLHTGLDADASRYALAYRAWIGAIQKKFPETECIKYEKGVFHIDMKKQDRHNKPCHDNLARYVSTDGINGPGFIEGLDVAAQALVFQGKDFVAQLRALLTKAKKHDDKVDSRVPAKAVAQLEAILPRIESAVEVAN